MKMSSLLPRDLPISPALLHIAQVNVEPKTTRRFPMLSAAVLIQ